MLMAVDKPAAVLISWRKAAAATATAATAYRSISSAAAALMCGGVCRVCGMAKAMSAVMFERNAVNNGVIGALRQHHVTTLGGMSVVARQHNAANESNVARNLWRHVGSGETGRQCGAHHGGGGIE